MSPTAQENARAAELTKENAALQSRVDALEKALAQKEHALIAVQQEVIEIHTQYQGQ